MRGQSTAARTCRRSPTAVRRGSRAWRRSIPPSRAGRRGRPRARAAVHVARAHVSGFAIRPAPSGPVRSARRWLPRRSRRGGSRSRRAASRLAVGHAHEPRRLARPQLGHEVEQAEARRFAAALDRVGIAHAPPEDLQPPQIPSTGTPASARRTIAPARPSCAASRGSASVLGARECTITAAASTSAALRTKRACAPSGANSSRFAMRECDDRDATLASVRLWSATPSSSGKRHVQPRDDAQRRHAGALLEPLRAGGEQRRVATEAVEQEAREQIALGSERQCHVPSRCANAPPRSMSQHSSTGAPASSATAMLTMSPARRLISAGLPAPSMTTTS